MSGCSYRTRVGVGLALLLLFLSASGRGFCTQLREQPIRITADRLEADNKEKKITFTGSVRAVQGDIVITCRRMIVFYSGKGESPQKEQDIKRIIAQGKVILTQKNREVRGDKAEYFNKEGKVVITGNAMAKEGPNIIRGHRIVYYVDEKRSIIEGGNDKQVEATIYPRQGKRP